MTAAEFDAIPADGHDPIDGYYDALIDRNERIGESVHNGSDHFHELTAGQRMLIQLGTFDGQVSNGGITQYFWNRTDSIFDVAEWMAALGQTELQALYERALESLFGKKEEWLALKAEWSKGGRTPRWETFQSSYELLDLDWFNKAYFDRRGYNERQEWVCLARGLNYPLLSRLAEYVREHRDEFITESGAD